MTATCDQKLVALYDWFLLEHCHQRLFSFGGQRVEWGGGGGGESVQPQSKSTYESLTNTNLSIIWESLLG
jgi:hypothetical protein